MDARHDRTPRGYDITYTCLVDAQEKIAAKLFQSPIQYITGPRGNIDTSVTLGHLSLKVPSTRDGTVDIRRFLPSIIFQEKVYSANPWVPDRGESDAEQLRVQGGTPCMSPYLDDPVARSHRSIPDPVHEISRCTVWMGNIFVSGGVRRW